uniref:Uncharacterized protein n=1 Tax=Oryza sativa subsp. japonica TaxID=39947 RepID=Q33AX6_ORYSJ|nr:hypothetical protein LOC_Os10g07139 [Oryza sativa Japonica Group]
MVINHQSWERMSIKNGNIFYVDGLTWF